MKLHTKTLLIALTTSALLALAPASHADSIQFDFGDLQGSYSGTAAPAHDDGWLGAGDTTWNTLLGDTGSGLFYADGTAATGVSIDFGRVSDASTAVDWADDPTGQTNGGGATTGFYGTELMNDWVFTDGRSNPGLLAVRVSGLAPGEYQFYGITREYTALSRDYTVGIGVDTDSTTTLDDLTTTALTDATGSSDWILGQNYATQTLTVNSTSDYLVYIVREDTTGNFGSMNGLQIALVPEPASGAMALIGLGALAMRRRRG